MSKVKNFFDFIEGEESEIINEIPIDALKNELKADGIDIDLMIGNIRKKIQQNKFSALREKSKSLAREAVSNIDQSLFDKNQIIGSINEFLQKFPSGQREAFSAHYRNLDEMTAQDLQRVLSNLKLLNDGDWKKDV